MSVRVALGAVRDVDATLPSDARILGRDQSREKATLGPERLLTALAAVLPSAQFGPIPPGHPSCRENRQVLEDNGMALAPYGRNVAADPLEN